MHLLHPMLAALAALPAAARVVPAEDATPTPAQETSEFGEPLYVNGKRVSDNEIKRFLIYSVGRNQFAYRKVDLIIDDELRQRAWYKALDEEAEKLAQADAAGEPAPSEDELQERRVERYRELYKELLAKFAVPDDAFQKEYDRRIEDFQKKYPILNLEAEISRAFQSVPQFRRALYQNMYFDNVYLPENPDDWPAVTVEAFRADPAGGDLLLTDAKQSYEQRLKWKQENDLEQIPPDDDLLKSIHRQIVRDAVWGLVDFRTASDGLPDDMVLWADTNGDGTPELEVTTADLWEEVAPLVDEQEVIRAKRYWAVVLATSDRMAAEGILLSPEETTKAFKAYEDSYSEEAFGVEVAAQQTEGFPSLESFRQYYSLLEGYKRFMEPKLQPGPNGEPNELLKRHLPYAHKNLGLGQVDAEVLLVPAFDFQDNAWKKNGFKSALTQANEIIDKIEHHRQDYAEQRQREIVDRAKGLDAGPEVRVPEPNVFWSEMMDDYSGWWDPPPPAQGKPPAAIGMKKKGRFGPKYRNDLMGFMGETPFEDFIWGSLITDFVFFEQEVNTIAGPFCGPRGYYITKVLRRTGPTRPMSMSEPFHVQRIKDDFLRVSFRDYAQEALASASVQGIPERCED
jgi:hypothetical protein